MIKMTDRSFDFDDKIRIYDKDRFEDPSIATALIHVHAPLNLWRSNYSQLYSELQTYELALPVWIAMGRGSIAWPEVVVTESSSSQEDNLLKIAMNSHTVKIENSHFLIITTPLTDSGLSANYEQSRHRLDVIASSIALHFGINFVPKHAIEVTIKVDKGEVIDSPRGRRLPRVTDGPYLTPSRWFELDECLNALKGKDENTRNRIERSLAIFRNAQHTQEGYIYYWTALETLCATDKLKSRLQKCYRAPDTATIEQLFKVDALKKLRNDLIHEGAPYTISGDVERFVQVMYLDLLRNELGLAHKGYMERFKNTPEINLADIGIESNGSKT